MARPLVPKLGTWDVNVNGSADNEMYDAAHAGKDEAPYNPIDLAEDDILEEQTWCGPLPSQQNAEHLPAVRTRVSNDHGEAPVTLPLHERHSGGDDLDVRKSSHPPARNSPSYDQPPPRRIPQLMISHLLRVHDAGRACKDETPYKPIDPAKDDALEEQSRCDPLPLQQNAEHPALASTRVSNDHDEAPVALPVHERHSSGDDLDVRKSSSSYDQPPAWRVPNLMFSHLLGVHDAAHTGTDETPYNPIDPAEDALEEQNRCYRPPSQQNAVGAHDAAHAGKDETPYNPTEDDALEQQNCCVSLPSQQNADRVHDAAHAGKDETPYNPIDAAEDGTLEEQNSCDPLPLQQDAEHPPPARTRVPNDHEEAPATLPLHEGHFSGDDLDDQKPSHPSARISPSYDQPPARRSPGGPGVPAPGKRQVLSSFITQKERSSIPTRPISGARSTRSSVITSSPSSSADSSVSDAKSNGVIVPFPPAAVKASPKPSITFTKSAPRSASPSTRATIISNGKLSPVIPAFPSGAVKSSPKPSITSIRSASRSASPSARATSTSDASIKSAPRSASFRSASPSSRTTSTSDASIKSAPRSTSFSARATSTSDSYIKTAPRSASPSGRPTSTSDSSIKSAPRSSSPSARATSTSDSSIKSASRPASPSGRAASTMDASLKSGPRSASPSTRATSTSDASMKSAPRPASPSKHAFSTSDTSLKSAPRATNPSARAPITADASVKSATRLASPSRRSTSNSDASVRSALRPASPSTRSTSTLDVSGKSAPRSASPSTRPTSTSDASVKSAPRSASPSTRSTSTSDAKLSRLIVPFPPTAVKPSPKPSITLIKSAPRSASPSTRATSTSDAKLSSVIVPFPATTVRSSPKAPITSTKSASSTRAASGSLPRVTPIVSSRPASPSPANGMRKIVTSSSNQPPSPSRHTSDSRTVQLLALDSLPGGLSAAPRAAPKVGTPFSSTTPPMVLLTSANSVRHNLSSNASSQSLVKPKSGPLTLLTRKVVQTSSSESAQSLSSGRGDSNLDMPSISGDSSAVKNVVQEIPIQRLRIASFKRNSLGLSKATEIITPDFPTHLLTLNTKKRCGWITSQSDDVHIAYHDNEWGNPVKDDKLLFELIVLQGAQAELSWPTILARRNNFRAVFANFDPAIVAKFDEKKKLSLIADSSICFPEPKVRGAVDNAAHVLKIIEEYGSLSKFLWSFVNHKPIVSHYKLAKQVPVKTPKSEALSKELIRRGFTFVGPTTMYSVMQAAGLVNDHLVTCFKYQESSAENSPVTELVRDREEVPDSWQPIALGEWRGSTINEPVPCTDSVDILPLEDRRGSANSCEPVWAELPIIEEVKEDELEKSVEEDEIYDSISMTAKCEIPVC